MTDTPIEALVARLRAAAEDAVFQGDHDVMQEAIADLTAKDAELAQVKAALVAERALSDRLADFAEELALSSAPSPNCECRECRAASLVADHAALRKEASHG